MPHRDRHREVIHYRKQSPWEIRRLELPFTTTALPGIDHAASCIESPAALYWVPGRPFPGPTAATVIQLAEPPGPGQAASLMKYIKLVLCVGECCRKLKRTIAIRPGEFCIWPGIRGEP